MKNKKYLLILSVLVIVLLCTVSCTALYNDLASSYTPPQNLQTFQTTSTTQNALSTSSTQKQDGTTPSDDPNGPTNPPDDPSEPENPTWNTKDFTVLDENGNEVKLSDFAGKPIVVNFWATWCTYCVREMPDFQAAYEKYPDVQFVMVNVTDGYYETIDSAKQFVKEKGFTFPIFFDTESSAVTAYGITAYPQSLFIDANGNLVAQARGMIDLATLEQGISMIR